MKNFLDDNFLLQTETAQKLYHEYAKEMPIFDYHCHLSPKEIYEDKTYTNITEIWLYGDHYKWRFMRSSGVPEELCTGNGSDYDKFMAYAKAVQYAIGNPLYHWSHLELQRFFDIDLVLNEKNAPEIWEKANKKINEGGFSARKLIEQSNVDCIGTTDDPADSLEYHFLLQKDDSFKTRVVPTFRPDNAVNIEKTTFADYIKTLGASYDKEIQSFEDLKTVLSLALDRFALAGSKISDHAFETIPNVPGTEAEADVILKKALNGEAVSEKEVELYKTVLMLFFGKEYAKREFVMQLHIGAMRNNNTRMFNKLGPDTGYDSIHDLEVAKKLSRLLDALATDDLLPKTILYTLNPKDNFVLGTMLGNFQGDGIRGKIQFGSAWWFNDHKDGMEQQMQDLANLGCLAAFVGMLTDSRSFLSYPRHEYFRRILCNILGNWVENGEFPADWDTLKQIVQDICFNNAKNYFKM
ncbi:MAG: glucuronate isomerase [Clostridia bacterium]|nr:glucuronate isomerase [Clostridia bacterium]